MMNDNATLWNGECAPLDRIAGGATLFVFVVMWLWPRPTYSDATITGIGLIVLIFLFDHIYILHLRAYLSLRAQQLVALAILVPSVVFALVLFVCRRAIVDVAKFVLVFYVLAALVPPAIELNPLPLLGVAVAGGAVSIILVVAVNQRCLARRTAQVFNAALLSIGIVMTAPGTIDRDDWVALVVCGSAEDSPTTSDRSWRYAVPAFAALTIARLFYLAVYTLCTRRTRAGQQQVDQEVDDTLELIKK